MFAKAKSKALIYIIVGALSFLVFFTPVIVAGGVVAVPVVAIHDFFTGIGDFIFGSGDSNEAIVLIEEYLKSDAGKKIIANVYSPMISNEEQITVPLHWLVIPNLLAGIEEKDITKDLVKRQIQAMKTKEGKLRELESYINTLRKEEPWKSGFGSVSSTTIAGYVNEFSNYLGQEGSLNTGNLADEDFLYPLKKPAIVTSEVGNRNVGTINGVNVNNHTGIDLAYSGGDATTCGVPVYASMNGTVTKTEQTTDNGGANWGEITISNVNVWYLHLRDPFPHAIGTKIKKGEFVGYIGSSGLARGCHLHLEIHVDGQVVNPRKFIDFDNPKIFSYQDKRDMLLCNVPSVYKYKQKEKQRKDV